jgi:radical SAM superfamily enzyme YgiQ (UPF0313 family)
MGWKSLERHLGERQPQVVCIGEEVASATEGFRLAVLAKTISPACSVICGGHFFSNYVDETLTRYPVDFIIRNEGELPLLDLLQSLGDSRADLHNIPGIAFLDGDEIIQTPPRPPITNLDLLPTPAYDLLPMDLYGKNASLHPRLGAIEHSRGCTAKCSYCILWRTMGKPDRENPDQLLPFWRTKSVEKTMVEVELLVKKYSRYTLGFVDSTFNVSPHWTNAFCEEVLRRGLKFQYTIWARADYLIRDEKVGILEKMVRAGLVQVIIGVERANGDELNSLDKPNNGPEITREVFRILQKYPQVSSIGSFVYGTRNETQESLRKLVDFAANIGADFTFFIPMTPAPGTAQWKEAKEKDRIEVRDFRAYNFHTPVMSSEYLSRDELQCVYFQKLLKAFLMPKEFLRGALFHPNARKRSFYRKLAVHGLMVCWRLLLGQLRKALGLSNREEYYGIRPKWYDD